MPASLGSCAAFLRTLSKSLLHALSHIREQQLPGLALNRRHEDEMRHPTLSNLRVSQTDRAVFFLCIGVPSQVPEYVPACKKGSFDAQAIGRAHVHRILSLKGLRTSLRATSPGLPAAPRSKGSCSLHRSRLHKPGKRSMPQNWD